MFTPKKCGGVWINPYAHCSLLHIVLERVLKGFPKHLALQGMAGALGWCYVWLIYLFQMGINFHQLSPKPILEGFHHEVSHPRDGSLKDAQTSMEYLMEPFGPSGYDWAKIRGFSWAFQMVITPINSLIYPYILGFPKVISPELSGFTTVG